jgi:excisionase family DNA binding protein
MSADLARAIVASLDDQALDELARLLAPRLATHAARPTWLDVDGAAAHLNCSRRRVYDLVAQRRLTPHRDGRRLLFRRDQLDTYLEEEE